MPEDGVERIKVLARAGTKPVLGVLSAVSAVLGFFGVISTTGWFVVAYVTLFLLGLRMVWDANRRGDRFEQRLEAIEDSVHRSVGFRLEVVRTMVSPEDDRSIALRFQFTLENESDRPLDVLVGNAVLNLEGRPPVEPSFDEGLLHIRPQKERSFTSELTWPQPVDAPALLDGTGHFTITYSVPRAERRFRWFHPFGWKEVFVSATDRATSVWQLDGDRDEELVE